MAKKDKMFFLTDVSLATKVIRRADCLVVDETTEEVLDKNSKIENFLIIKDNRPNDYTGFPEKKTRGRKKEVILKDDLELEKELEEKDVFTLDDQLPNNGESEARISREGFYRLIANELRITEMSEQVLYTPAWYLVPVYEGMTEFRPVVPEEVENGYRLLMKSVPLFTLKESPFTKDDLSWKYASRETVANAIAGTEFDSRFRVYATFMHNKESQSIIELKIALRSHENAQKTRIKVGNTLVSSLYTSMGSIKFNKLKELIASNKGIRVPEVETEEDKKKRKLAMKDAKIIDFIIEEYINLNTKIETDPERVSRSVKIAEKHITKDGVSLQDELTELFMKKAKKSASTRIKNEAEFQAVKEKYGLKAISSYCVYNQVREYLNYKRIEDETRDYLVELVRKQEVWKRYLVGIKGIAEVNAAHLIGKFDIRTAKHPSSFLRYCGLDQITVTREPEVEVGRDQFINTFIVMRADYVRALNKIEEEGLYVEEVEDCFYSYKVGNIETYEQFIAWDKSMKAHGLIGVDIDNVVPLVEKEFDAIMKENEVIFNMVTSLSKKAEMFNVIDKNGTNVINIKKRARNKGDKAMTTYITKNGDIKTKFYLGYNSELKGRLLGVIFTCFQMSRTGGYAELYREYRSYLENRSDIKERIANKKPVHVHEMARRKVMQEFVKDFWLAWRQIEGLPLNGGTYEEAKLGIYHRENRPKILEDAADQKKDVPEVW